MGNQIVNASGTANLGLPIASVFAAQTLCYTFCQIVKDNSWIDVAWSLTFILPNLMIVGAKYAAKQPVDTRTLVMNACITVWGVRLATHIGMRHVGEDYRYVYLRKQMSKNGEFCYYVMAFFFIFMFQAGLAAAVNYTCLYTTANSSAMTFAAGGSNKLLWTDWMGLGLFSAGFIMEAFSDRQLQQHLSNEDPNKGKFCKIGFWRYSRHPNYFGDALLWWGLFCFSLSLPKGYWTVFSPVIMTILLRYVSGVRLLEQKQSKHPEFAQYAAETSAFIPWFPDLNAKAPVDKKNDEAYNQQHDEEE